MGNWYQRSPRIKPTKLKNETIIPTPPVLPSRPVRSLLAYIPAFAATVTGAGILMYAGFNKGMDHERFWFLTVGITLLISITYLVPLLVYQARTRTFHRENDKRTEKYLSQLEKVDEQLRIQIEKERSALLETDSDPKRCMQIVRRRSPSLWERSYLDDDFLRIRLGIGAVPSNIQVVWPEVENSEDDFLIEESLKLEPKYKQIENAPVNVPLIRTGPVGIVGDRMSCLRLVRSMVVQITTWHSPDEAKLSVFLHENDLTEWDWMRWLPHVWDEQMEGRRIAASSEDRKGLADELLDDLHNKGAIEDSSHQVVFISKTALIDNDPQLASLLYESDERLTAIIIAESVNKLPSRCGLIVECEGELGTYTLKSQDGATEVNSYTMDDITLEQADLFARSMAPIRLKKDSSRDLPNVLPLLDLLGVKRVEELEIKDRWEQHRFPATFPVTLGIHRGGKPFVLNLHDRLELNGHGPHGLIAGTTGAGKSALLQSLLASIAVDYHPHDAAFLMMDYKGGGMSGAFRNLPHVIGSMTNLDGRQIYRAKTALRAEMVRRQKVLQAAGYKEHIDEYYKSGSPGGPLPHLFVIIDEFAELKRDYPEFIDELISIAALGRTLGLHLILATQKPAGVVDDKIWSNARFRICLRVEDENDSRDMLKSPDAAGIRIPGRGYVQIGTGPLDEVQFAWCGQPYTEVTENAVAKSDELIQRVTLRGEREPFVSAKPRLDHVQLNDTKKQLAAIVDYVRDTAHDNEIESLEGPWLPPLPERFALSELQDVAIEPGKITATVGWVDDPARQQRYPLEVALDQGSFALYGMPGSGKTTFVQTLLMSLAGRYLNGEWTGYLLDMGRGMGDAMELPQIGDVLCADEEERISRLFRTLRKIVFERKERFAEAGVRTLQAYCQDPFKKLPYIVIIIDDYYSFRTRYPAESDQLDELLREGGGAGIRFVLTASRYGDIPEKTRSGIANSATLELAEPGDYFYLVGNLVQAGSLNRGRGYVKGLPPLEFQTALPSEGMDEAEVAASMRIAIKQLQQVWKGPKSQPIPSLPQRIALRELLSLGGMKTQRAEDVQVPLGLLTEDLSPLSVSLRNGPHFIVGAPMEGGKTAALQTWILSLAWSTSPENLKIYTIDGRVGGSETEGLSSLNSLTHIVASGSGIRGAADVVTLLDEHLKVDAGRTTSLLVIDDADILARGLQDFVIKDKLTALLRGSRDTGLHVLLSGVPRDFPTFGTEWFAEVMACQSGMLLGTRDSADLSIFRIPMTAVSAYQGSSGDMPILPAGQGFYINRRVEPIKTAVPFDRSWGMDVWTSRINGQRAVKV